MRMWQTRALLEECSLLSIEDILPRCPNFDVIEADKNDIVNDLRDYDADLHATTAEMVDYSRSVPTIRPKIGHVH